MAALGPVVYQHITHVDSSLVAFSDPVVQVLAWCTALGLPLKHMILQG
jgi:hypothetical protein